MPDKSHLQANTALLKAQEETGLKKYIRHNLSDASFLAGIVVEPAAATAPGQLDTWEDPRAVDKGDGRLRFLSKGSIMLDWKTANDSETARHLGHIYSQFRRFLDGGVVVGISGKKYAIHQTPQKPHGPSDPWFKIFPENGIVTPDLLKGVLALLNAYGVITHDDVIGAYRTFGLQPEMSFTPATGIDRPKT